MKAVFYFKVLLITVGINVSDKDYFELSHVISEVVRLLYWYHSENFKKPAMRFLKTVELSYIEHGI